MDLKLNQDLIEQKLNNADWKFLTEYIQNECQVTRNVETGQIIIKNVSLLDLKIFESLLNHMCTLLNENEVNTAVILLTRQIFVALRNCAAFSNEIQSQIALETNILHNSSRLIVILRNIGNQQQYNDCLVMILQFLGNLVVGNDKTQIIVWMKFNHFLLLFLTSEVPKVPSTAAMVLFNIFRMHTELLPDDILFIKNVIQLYDMEVDYALLILELIIPTKILIKYYQMLETKQRIIILELIYEMLPHALGSSITRDLILFFSLQFKQKSDCILKTVQDYVEDIEPLEVCHLLQVLASASSNDNYLPHLQLDKSLLINCIFLLKSIHMLGKEENNCFSMIQKLSKLTLYDAEVESIQKHPGFGFKAMLIRIIGNLCWRHNVNQDQVRELECISLLLDCCNIDARNPLIIQWVILAMKNLCEGNIENQLVIANMTKVGTVDSAVLHEMGLELNDGENKICIAPLELKNNHL